MKKIFITLSLLSTVSAFANVEYGMGGCGLGSVLLGKDKSQIAVATLNATGTQSFAITSGTSNCNGPMEKKSTKLYRFIDANSVAVETDIAKGSGETIATIANIMNCRSDIAKTLQKNYAPIYNQTNISPKLITDKINSILIDQCPI